MPIDPDTDLSPIDHAELEAWRHAYVERLAAPDGWWAIVGLTWLGEGPAQVGAAPTATVRLPETAAARVATLERSGDDVIVRPTAPGSLWHEGERVEDEVRVRREDRAFATGPGVDAIRFTVLVRGERRGVRVYDPARAAARGDTDVAWFPPQSRWRVPATFEPADASERLAVVNVLGDVGEVPVAGRLVFDLDGRRCRLVATRSGERLFVNFRDATSGRSTYGAGRFLLVDAPTDGCTHIDFNRAYHPPCAHTTHATCPLPPLENRLPVAVTAGERHPTGVAMG